MYVLLIKIQIIQFIFVPYQNIEDPPLHIYILYILYMRIIHINILPYKA